MTEIDSSRAPGIRIRRITSSDDADLAHVSEMHMELLHFGPMAGLGESFVREVCYRSLLRAGVLSVAILEVDAQPAGFVAYTSNSYDFHRLGMRSSWFVAATELLKACIRQWRHLGRIFRAVGVLLSRRQEQQPEPGANGEVVCVAVRPEYLRPAFARSRRFRASEGLIRYAAAQLSDRYVSSMRMLVDAENKAVLLLYHSLGARFEPYEQAGEEMVQVWFDVQRLASLEMEA